MQHHLQDPYKQYFNKPEGLVTFMLKFFYLAGLENYHHLQSSRSSLLLIWMLHADPALYKVGLLRCRTLTKCHKSFGQQQK